MTSSRPLQAGSPSYAAWTSVASRGRRAPDLRGQPVVEPIDQVADVVGDVAAVESFAAPVAGVEDFFQLFGGGDDLVVVGQRAVAEMVDLGHVIVGADDPLGQLGELVFESEVGSHGGGG